MDKISRRNALKTLLATAGGLGAAAFLPSRWVKPVVESGVLPVHAQSSSTNGVRGYTGDSWHEVYAGVSSDPVDEWSFLYGKTGLASAGGHAKHAAPAKDSALIHPVEGVNVTLWTSVDELTTRTKFTGSTNPLQTDRYGFTGGWDVGASFDGWGHFVISGDVFSLRIVD